MASRYCSRYQSSVLCTHTRQLWRSSEGSPTQIQFLGYDDASLRWLKATARACCRADGFWVLFFFLPPQHLLPLSISATPGLRAKRQTGCPQLLHSRRQTPNPKCGSNSGWIYTRSFHPASCFPFSGTLLTQSWMHSQLSRQISEQILSPGYAKPAASTAGQRSPPWAAASTTHAAATRSSCWSISKS